MGIRDDGRTKYINTRDIYLQQMNRRGVKNGINHLSTQNFKTLTVEEIATLDVIAVPWKTGDRLFKYASEYYSDPRLWWVIALFNLKPTDSHFKIGDTVLIPTPIERVLTLYGF